MIPEAFADRRYESNGGLRARHLPNAVIDDPDELRTQVYQLQAGRLVCGPDDRLEISAHTLCVHSDSRVHGSWPDRSGRF